MAVCVSIQYKTMVLLYNECIFIRMRQNKEERERESNEGGGGR